MYRQMRHTWPAIGSRLRLIVITIVGTHCKELARTPNAAASRSAAVKKPICCQSYSFRHVKVVNCTPSEGVSSYKDLASNFLGGLVYSPCCTRACKLSARQQPKLVPRSVISRTRKHAYAYTSES